MQPRKVKPAVPFDLEVLIPLLRAFTETTGLRVGVLQPDGSPLTDDFSVFACDACAARTQRGMSPCQRRTREAARATAAGRIAHLYACHDDVTGLAVPLFGESGVAVTLCVGPVRLTSEKMRRLRSFRRVSASRKAARRQSAPLIFTEQELNDLAQLLTGAGHFALRGQHPFRPQAAEMRLVIDLVRGNVRSEQEARARQRYLGQRFVPAIVFVADIDDFARHTRGHSESACQLLKENVLRAIRTAVGSSLSALISGDTVVVILREAENGTHRQREARTVRRAMELAEKARRAVREQTGVTVTIGVGRTHAGPLEVHKSYLEAQSAVYHKRLLGKDRVIFNGDIEPEEPPAAKLATARWPALMTALRSGNRDLLRRTLQELLDERGATSDDQVVTLKHFALQLVTRAADMAAQRGLSARVSANLPFEFARSIEDLARAGAVRAALVEQMLSLADSIAGHSGRWATDRMAIARSYIEAHLASPLTLTRVAREAAYMSTAHFSRVFKRATGESFVQYLNRLRIERAQELLRDSKMTINEISLAVGYSSQHYFSKVFRRFTAVTPNEFRRVT